MPVDPRRAKELFQAALDLPDPAERPAFLDREAAGDPVASADFSVDDAPPTHAETGHHAPDLGTPTVGDSLPQTATYRREETADPVGTLVAGRYKVRQEIGEGGMGSVYLAEQTTPVKRQVALKLIKPGMDSRTVLARFESERQALALMDHPNIAKVLDAGTTDAGRPYFVMELVKGVPLTDYCDAHQLDLPARLALFRQICSAVQHAHQEGIIHRDLKPTNILVESHDGKPVPKVIDFGLAKATSGMPLTDQSLYTAFGSVTGTPLYMAPEQASFNALDVDTRADIYALGVILYELLTGSTPIQRDTLKRAGLMEMLRVIREDEPPTPSSRLSTSEGLPAIAATRHIEPSRLSRFVRGDLDWIVMKALAKERNRRYDSAIGLANDVERFTNHEPVSAGPPGAAYRLRKFVRRHRGRVAAASLVLVALVGGIVGTTLGLIEARRQRGLAVAQEAQTRKRLGQRDKANEVLLSIFADLNPSTGDKDTLPLPDRLGRNLDLATAALEGESTDDPLGVAQMQGKLGRAQLGLGHFEQAIALFVKSRSTLASRLGPDHPNTLASMTNLATGYQAAGKLDRAMPLLEETLALSKAKLGPDHPDTLKSMGNLAAGYWATGKLDRAIPLFEETLKLRVVKSGEDHPDTWLARANLGVNYLDSGRVADALPHLEGAFQASRRYPEIRWIGAKLLEASARSDHADQVPPVVREILAEGRASLPAGSLPLAGLLAQMGSTLLDAHAWPDSEPILRECLDIREKAEPDAWTTANTRSLLGGALLGQSRHAEAEPLLRSGYEGLKQRADAIPPGGRHRPGQALDRLIALAEATGKPEEAKAWREERAKLPAAPAPVPTADKK